MKAEASARREKGSAIVEFALIAPIFFLLLFAIIDFGLLFWVNLTMQHAVREGARFAVTGQTCSFGNPPTAQQRYQCVIKGIKDSSIGLYDLVSPTMTISINNGTPTTYNNPGEYTPGMFGIKDDIVALQLNCNWPLLTPLIAPFFSGAVYEFSVATTMRNEAFQ